MKHIRIFFCISIVFLLQACGGSKKAVRTPPTPKRPMQEVKIYQPEIPSVTKGQPPELTQIKFNNTEEYIFFFKDFAIQKMRQYGIPASITLAQGVLESGSGRSELAFKSNNHFGIKCHEWTGERVYHDDDEKGECFRKYPDPRQSYEDHSLFLTTRKRYADLFSLNPSDYHAWARGLKKAGYATDPRYPQKLTKIIEDYRLYQYDKEALGEKYKTTVAEKSATTQPNDTPIVQVSNTNVHVVQSGETLYSISKAYNTDVAALKVWNQLTDNTLHIGQSLYVQAPDSQSVTTVVRYVVKPGDTLYAISRLTGLGVDEIKNLNNLSSNEISVGQELIIKK
ncbi:MAG: LysM peptidoglycan-binding domain-containing protein [Bacteroidetes bacterium]|nr:LysM peptidoglycan-binding domain-containing protein [Bacteroidota bacterium]